MESNIICPKTKVHFKIRSRALRDIIDRYKNSRVRSSSEDKVSKTHIQGSQRGYATSIILVSMMTISFFSIITIYLKLDQIQKKDDQEFKDKWQKLGEKYES
jgi:hypothetical protein